MYDRFTAGAIGGLVAGIVMGVLAMALNILKICKLCIIAIGAGIFASQLLSNPSIPWILFGWTVHVVVSTALGVGSAVIFTYIGTNYYLLKGAAIGGLIFLINVGGLGHFLGVIPPNPEILSLFILFGYHLIFGLLASYIIVKYGRLDVKI